MNTPEGALSATSYVGRVRNGVVVLDGPVNLREGQVVRVEPIGEKMGTQGGIDRTDRLQQLQQLFAEWTQEDAKLADEEADRLRTALEQSRGLSFRSPNCDRPHATMTSPLCQARLDRDVETGCEIMGRRANPGSTDSPGRRA
jgi:hypothetical protein